MRTGWRTVGAIIGRVVADAEAAAPDRLDGLRRIGIDEISYRVGQRSLTVVVDHDTGRLVWASEGRDKQTVKRVFDLLGVERAAPVEVVSSDLDGSATPSTPPTTTDTAEHPAHVGPNHPGA